MSKQELHPRTAVLNKSQKSHSKKLKIQALHWLAAHFPLAFDNTLRIRPLKPGIMDDILLHADQAAAEGISRGKLREAVVIFTRRLDYLACLKAREMRVDLYGNEVGEVTVEEAEHAAVKIRKKVEKSVRNTRKLINQKNTQGFLQQAGYTKSNSQVGLDSEEHFPTYPPRAATMSTSTIKSAAVIVKHKTTKQYDPNAVARLKEKLGLSMALDKQKETAE